MKATILATTALILAGGAAHATFTPVDTSFITVPATPELATFTFAGFESAHTDTLLLMANGVPIFTNTMQAVGDVVTTILDRPGINRLELYDKNNGFIWSSDVAQNVDGIPHLFSTTNWNDFNAQHVVGPQPFPSSIFYGWEDLPNSISDHDNNDLIFTLSVVPTPPGVPEPASIAVLGGGLVLLGLVRRRRSCMPCSSS
jgi:hypothetical protein